MTIPPPPDSTLFPYTTLFRSLVGAPRGLPWMALYLQSARHPVVRSEEHTSELQSRPHLVCRLLLEKKKEDRRAVLRMLVERGMDLPVEVVRERDVAPEALVPA